MDLAHSQSEHDDPARDRILIVDDQASSRLLIGSVLEAAGYTCLAYAGDGVEAIEWLAAPVGFSEMRGLLEEVLCNPTRWCAW